MSATAPVFTIDDIALFERPVRFRMPFRFGAATLDHAPQAFVRARIRLANGVTASGASAEMMMPKWFDKNPALDNDANIEQLRRSLRLASDAYRLDLDPASAFGHHARHYRSLSSGASERQEPLVAGYGPALIDRAVLDALGRALHGSFFALIRDNLVGFHAAELAPDLAGMDDRAFLSSLDPRNTIEARHTIGLADPLDAESAPDDDGLPLDGLPRTLVEIVRAYFHRWYKIKLSGDIDADCRRLRAIAAILERMVPDPRITLDGNEQYRDVAHLEDAWRAISGDAALRKLASRIAWIEQPIARARAMTAPVAPSAVGVPLIIDESDADLDAFPRALGLGYRGVSSKSCKGLYKSLINLARTRRWNDSNDRDPAFVTGEDLTMQAGIAVQQDLALASLLGLEHVERNGHHYVAGMQGASPDEQRAFALAHPDLYSMHDGRIRLTIARGRIALGSLHCEGFASAAEPDWRTMMPMREADPAIGDHPSAPAAASDRSALDVH